MRFDVRLRRRQPRQRIRLRRGRLLRHCRRDTPSEEGSDDGEGDDEAAHYVTDTCSTMKITKAIAASTATTVHAVLFMMLPFWFA